MYRHHCNIVSVITKCDNWRIGKTSIIQCIVRKNIYNKFIIIDLQQVADDTITQCFIYCALNRHANDSGSLNPQ